MIETVYRCKCDRCLTVLLINAEDCGMQPFQYLRNEKGWNLSNRHEEIICNLCVDNDKVLNCDGCEIDPLFRRCDICSRNPDAELDSNDD